MLPDPKQTPEWRFDSAPSMRGPERHSRGGPVRADRVTTFVRVGIAAVVNRMTTSRQTGEYTAPGSRTMAFMSFEQILFEQKEPGIFLLTINRPKQLNALSPAVFDELEHALHALSENEQARVLLVTGAGEKAFVAGADIARFQDLTPMQALAVSKRGLAVFGEIEDLPIPAIALVNGYALGGGCEFALACDFILASDNAVFGQPEVNLGIMPGLGGTQRLSRLVGRNRALELMMTGRQVKADEALRLGLANAVFPREQLLEKGMEIARTLAAKPAVALRLIKQAVQRGQDLDLDKACLVEAEAFGLCFSTNDQKEGIAAFLEKRTARFAGD